MSQKFSFLEKLKNDKVKQAEAAIISRIALKPQTLGAIEMLFSTDTPAQAQAVTKTFNEDTEFFDELSDMLGESVDDNAYVDMAYADEMPRKANQYIPVAIDIEITHCSKTGQPISKTLDPLFDSKITDANQINYEAASVIQAVHPSWLQTDAKSLDYLQQNDPHGYFCFCYARIVRPSCKGYNKSKNAFKTLEEALAFHGQLVLLWQEIQSVSYQEIATASVYMQEYLAVFGNAGLKLFSPDMAATVAHQKHRLANFIQGKITLALRNRIKETAHFNYVAKNPAFFGNLIANIEKPASQFSQQARIKQKSKQNQVNAMFDNLGFGKIKELDDMIIDPEFVKAMDKVTSSYAAKTAVKSDTPETNVAPKAVVKFSFAAKS